ncbi:MAG TPA: histidine phosphatase family protein [Candidatus Angelobacter sp.]|nr:histidine phosphatase family protein [Candidatus Angelobacter sp.]
MTNLSATDVQNNVINREGESHTGHSVHSSSKSQEIWLIRHGETEWTLSGAHTGKTDIPLTDAGRSRAKAVGGFLTGRRFGMVLSSPLKRALDTCRLAGYGDVVETDPMLCEWDYGDYEGRTTLDIRKTRPGWFLWTAGVPNGESLEEVGTRADRVIERANSISQSSTSTVALFAHGHILRILAARWLGLPADAGRLLSLGTGTVSVLGYERDVRVITRWNVDPVA